MLENISAWIEKQDDIPVGWTYIGDDKVRNIKGYLMAALFKDGSTMGSYYKTEVNFDMPQFTR